MSEEIRKIPDKHIAYKCKPFQHPSLTKVLLAFSDISPHTVVSDIEQPKTGCLRQLKAIHDAEFELSLARKKLETIVVKKTSVVLDSPLKFFRRHQRKEAY